MKKALLIGLAIVTVAIITGILVVQKMSANLDALVNQEITDVDLNEVPDGTFRGYYSVFPVIVTLDVTVVDHVITTISIIEHQNGQGTPAEVITLDVILSQTLQVDSIAGATYSSKVILLAVENALLEQTYTPE